MKADDLSHGQEIEGWVIRSDHKGVRKVALVWDASCLGSFQERGSGRGQYRRSTLYFIGQVFATEREALCHLANELNDKHGHLTRLATKVEDKWKNVRDRIREIDAT